MTEPTRFPFGLGQIIVFLMISAGVYYYYYLNKRKKDKRSAIQQILESVSQDEPDFGFQQKYLLSRAEIRIKYDFALDLGFGSFETVYRSVVRRRKAALKIFNSERRLSPDALKAALDEAALMNYLGEHPFLVEFIGVNIDELGKGILYTATGLYWESLHQYLKSWRDEEDVSQEGFKKMLKFSYEIASGMEYLSGMKVVHGDLCTKNVFLDDNFTCKIGQYELSQRLYEKNSYRLPNSKSLRYRWAAVESLKSRELSCKTDVWSYGVTAWEVFSLGASPYPGVQNVLPVTSGFVHDLQNGLRLERPSYATEEIYLILCQCWTLHPGQRPPFSSLAKDFLSMRGSLV